MDQIKISPNPPPPLFPSPSSSSSIDFSSLEFILALIAIITIPALIYTFFFSLKCPPTRRGRHHHHHHSTTTATLQPPPSPSESSSGGGDKEVVTFKRESHVKDMGTECPVCLSLFLDGEDVKQLRVCKHSFHVHCIDPWLGSHSNCPVCRASVSPIKHGTTSNDNGNDHRRRRRDGLDFQQGLPDASTLV